MAINYELLNKGGISLSANFELLSEKPLDARLVVPSLEGLQNYIDNAAAYEGMIVFVTAEKETYQVVKNADGALTYEIFGITEEEVRQWILNDTTAAVEFIGVTDKLPTITNEATARGNMYKASGTFALPAENNAEANAAALTVKIGDSIVYNGNGKWYHIPAGDVDTWRKIHVVNGDTTVTLKDTVDLTLIAGENITLDATENGEVTISSKNTDTHHEAHLVFGNQDDDTACENADTSTGALYMNLVENGEIRDAHKIAVANDTPMVITHSKDDATLTFEILENSKDDNGYVKASNGQANKVWKTDENGNPDWRDDEDTQYTGEDKIIVEGTVIKHEKLPENTEDGNKHTPVVTEAENAASTVISGVTIDEYGHVTGYETAEVNVSLDGKSIDRNDAGEIEIKGFEDVEVSGLIPQVKIGSNNEKSLEWVSVKEAISGEDKDTITGVKSGNSGVVVEKQTPPDEGEDRTYVVSHKAKPTNKDDDYDVNNVASQETKGNSGTYVTDVIIDEFGHVAGVHKATDLDTKYDLKLGENATDNNGIASSYDPYLNLVEDGTVKAYIKFNGQGGTKIIGTSNTSIEDQELIIIAPELTLKKDEKWWDDLPEDQIPDTVNVVSYDHIYAQFVDGEDVNEANKHQLAIEKMVVPTKKYVDRLVSGATSYLGTVASEAELKALNPGKGDFVRVSAAFGEYHASDMLICETPKTEGADATWSLIHGEIDTDTNTWELNTKTADGYVKKGEGHANQVWKTDADGNPDWRDEQDISGKMDKVSDATAGHYAIFDEKGQVVDGGVIDADVSVCDTFNSEQQTNGVIGFNLYEKHESDHEIQSENPIVGMYIMASQDSGIEIYNTSGNSGQADNTSRVAMGSIGLTDATKESLAKADTAIQEITSNCTNEEEDHANLNCTTSGLKVTRNKDDNGEDIPGSINVEIDDSITFIFNCGGAADCI